MPNTAMIHFHRASLPQSLTAIYISVMLVAFPLFTGTAGYASITFSKFLFFALATGIYLIFLIIACIISKSRLQINTGCVFALAFLGAVLLSTAFSPFFSQALLGASRYDGMVTLGLYGLLFLAVSRFGAWKREYALLLSLSTGACCLVALLQLLGINCLWLFPDGLTYYDGNISYTGTFLGTTGNVDVTSAFLCLGLPCCFALPFLYQSRMAYLADVSLALGVFVQAEGGSDAGALALILTGILASVIIGRKPEKASKLCLQLAVVFASLFASSLLACDWSRKCLAVTWTALSPVYAAITGIFICLAAFLRRKAPSYSGKSYAVAVISAFACCLIAGACFLAFGSFDSGTLHELQCILQGRMEDSFASSRIGIWKEVLRLVRERPLLGGGPDTLALRTDYSFHRYIDALGKARTTYLDNAHSEYLGYLANIGLMGLVSYLGLIFSSVQNGIKGKKSPVPMLCILCYGIQALFGLGLCFTVPLLFLMLALINTNNQYPKEI